MGSDESGHAAMARYDYFTAGPWMTRYCIGAFAWIVPVPFRTKYTDVYALSLVKGVVGEIADVDIAI